MASGKERVNMIIGTDYNGEFIILQAPIEMHEVLDGCYCTDNGFNKTTLPKDEGVYAVECDVFWDDGKSYYGEPSDPDWEIRVVEYKKLLSLG